MKLLFSLVLLALLLVTGCAESDSLYDSSQDSPVSLGCYAFDTVDITMSGTHYQFWDTYRDKLVNEGDTVIVNDTITFCALLYNNQTPLEVQWEVGDSLVALGESMEYAFTKAGSYDVIASIEDGAGFRIADTQRVVISTPSSAPLCGYVHGKGVADTLIQVGFKKEIDTLYTFVKVNKDGYYTIETLDHNYRYDILYEATVDGFQPHVVKDVAIVYGQLTTLDTVFIADTLPPLIERNSFTKALDKRTAKLYGKLMELGYQFDKSTVSLIVDSVSVEPTLKWKGNSTYDFEYEAQNLVDGSHRVSLSLSDASGNRVDTTWGFSVDATIFSLHYDTLAYLDPSDSEIHVIVGDTFKLETRVENLGAPIKEIEMVRAYFHSGVYHYDTTIVEDPGTSAIFPYTFTKEGRCVMHATMRDVNGVVHSTNLFRYNVKSGIPSVYFIYDIDAKTINDTMTLKPKIKDTLGTITSVAWSINGGSFNEVDPLKPDTLITLPSVEQNAYPITLRVMDNDSNVAEYTRELKVHLDPPEVEISKMLKGTTDSLLTLKTFYNRPGKEWWHNDFDGTWYYTVGSIVSYEWSIGSLDNFTVTTTVDTLDIQIGPDEADSFPIVLKVTDDDNISTYDTTYISIRKKWYQMGKNISNHNNISSLEFASWREEDAIIAYVDKERDGAPVVKSYHNGFWESLGYQDKLAGTVSHLSLSLHEDTPYITYVNSKTGAIEVAWYDGIEWEPLGSCTDSSGGYYLPKLTINAQGDLLCVYAKKGSSSLWVKRYSNGSWELLGAPLALSADPVSLSLESSSGELFLSYIVGETVHVASYTGGVWSTIALSAYRGKHLKTVLYEDRLFVAFIDVANGHCAMLFSYLNGELTPIGAEPPSTVQAVAFDFAFAADGTAHIAFLTDENAVKVYRYVDTEWQAISNSMKASQAEIELIFSGSDKPQVAYPSFYSSQYLIAKEYR